MEINLEALCILMIAFNGTNLLFNSNFSEPLNIGISTFVSINELVDILEKITQIKLIKKIST